MIHPLVPIPQAMANFYDLPLAVPFRFDRVETTRPPLVGLDELVRQLGSMDESDLVSTVGSTAREQLRLLGRDWPDIQSLERYLAIGNAAMARHLAEKLVAAHPRRAAGHFGIGRAALLEGRWEAAVGSFRAALQHSPGSMGIQSELVLALAASGAVVEALAALAGMNGSSEARSFRRLFQPGLKSGDPVAWLARALQLGRFQSSGIDGPDSPARMTALSELIDIYPMDAPILELTARAALEAGQVELAKTLADRSTRLDRQASDGWLVLSEIALRSHDYPEAERTAGMALNMEPDSRLALMAMARTLNKDNRPAHAARLLRPACDQWPEDRSLRSLLAGSLIQSGDRNGAQAELEAIVVRWPGDPLGWFHLGRVAEANGDLDRAWTAFATARGLTNRFDEAREAAALLMVRRGDPDAGRLDLLAMTDEYPDSPYGWRGLGDLELAERPTEAARCYAEALARRPGLELAGAEHLAGLTELKGCRYPEAARHFEFAVRLDPRRHESWCCLGVALHESGRQDESLHAMREAARIAPEQAGYHGNLATFYRAAFRRNPLRHWRLHGMARQSLRRSAELKSFMETHP